MANSLQQQQQIYKNVKNPFQGLDSTTQLSGFQKFLDRIGLTNYAGKLDYQQQLASNQWDSEFQSAQSDIFYNSPENQAELQRQAGLNPDLNGVENFEADSANSMNTPFQQLQQEIDEPLNKIFSGLLSGIQTAVGISQGIISMKNVQLENDAKVISSVDDFVKTFEELGKKSGLYPDIAYKLLGSVKNRKLRKGLTSTLDSIFSNPVSHYPENNLYESNSYLMQNQERYADNIGNPFRSNDNPFDVASMALNVRDVTKLELDLYKVKIAAEKKVAKLQRKSAAYDLSIGAYKSKSDYQKIVSDFQKRVHEVLSSFFEKKIHDDDLFTHLMLNSMLAGQTGALDPVQSVINAGSNLIPHIGFKNLSGGFSVSHSR